MEPIENIDLKDVDIDTSDLEQKAPEKEDWMKGKRISKKKVAGWILGAAGIGFGIFALLSNKDKEQSTEE